MSVDIIVAGVGGQGSILASHVRFGEGVYGPLVGRGQALTTSGSEGSWCSTTSGYPRWTRRSGL